MNKFRNTTKIIQTLTRLKLRFNVVQFFQLHMSISLLVSSLRSISGSKDQENKDALALIFSYNLHPTTCRSSNIVRCAVFNHKCFCGNIAPRRGPDYPCLKSPPSNMSSITNGSAGTSRLVPEVLLMAGVQLSAACSFSLRRKSICV